jgi:hypothetical protein
MGDMPNVPKDAEALGIGSPVELFLSQPLDLKQLM